ncbi:MAG: hypothetical protein HY043_14345 [Verrucomicrobia bacterium]|nr:hypothetical protein [Verrucomicrobiota bacterium]
MTKKQFRQNHPVLQRPVRRFLKKLVSEWPYFFYADALENEFIIELIKCMADNISTGYMVKNESRAISLMSQEQIKKAWDTLIAGLQTACAMDGLQNQIRFDARFNELLAFIEKRLVGGI